MTTSLEAQAKALYYAEGWKNWDRATPRTQSLYRAVAAQQNQENNVTQSITTSTHMIESSQQMNSADIINNISKLADIIGPDIVNADIRCYGDGGRVFKITATMKETA